MVDAQMRRAPNASMSFIDAKVRFNANHTMGWLEHQDKAVMRYLVEL